MEKSGDGQTNMLLYEGYHIIPHHFVWWGIEIKAPPSSRYRETFFQNFFRVKSKDYFCEKWYKNQEITLVEVDVCSLFH